MTAFIPMTRPSRRCFETVEGFDDVFATNVRSPFFYGKTYGRCFGRKGSTGMGSTTGTARARTGVRKLMQRREIRMVQNDRTADRKSTRLNSSHANISYAVFCLKKKKIIN